ncbi:hypothetical protein BH11MYX2_BH11MYX2_24010 [soil metagenome]
MKRLALCILALAACGGTGSGNGDDGDDSEAPVDARAGGDGAHASDAGHDAPTSPDASPPSDASTPPPPGAKRVFVTSLRYPADLKSAGGKASGRESADSICQTLADASSLGGTFVAWLSTSDMDAIDHVTGPGPWYRIDGVMVFANRAKLGAIPTVAINVDETMGKPDPYYESWTGTSLGGHHTPPGSRVSTTCNDWTTTVINDSVEGTLGIFGNGFGQDVGRGADWTQYTVGYCAPFARHLYCFEQQ